VGALATWWFGLPGVIVVMITSSLVSLVTALWLLCRRLPRQSGLAPGVLARASAD
jgi:hypothetical protein